MNGEVCDKEGCVSDWGECGKGVCVVGKSVRRICELGGCVSGKGV